MAKIYFWLLVVLGFYFSLKFAVGVFLVSLLLACLPLAKSWFMFLLPIGLLVYYFCSGHSTFAWWCIVFMPFHYIAFTSNVVRAIKGIWNTD